MVAIEMMKLIITTFPVIIILIYFTSFGFRSLSNIVPITLALIVFVFVIIPITNNLLSYTDAINDTTHIQQPTETNINYKDANLSNYNVSKQNFLDWKNSNTN